MTTNESTPRTRSARIRKAARNATPSSGSALVATLERVWAKVQEFARNAGTELTTVHVVTGIGREAGGIRLGHVTVEPVWRIVNGKAEPVQVYELTEEER